MSPKLQARFFEAPVPLTELPTPCLLLDESRLERNAARLAAHWKDSSACLRPHLKTCRCWEVARRILPSATSPCTVATMGEAEAVASLGARDIVLAVGIRPSLFARARALMEQGTDLKVLLDSRTMAQALADYAREQGCTFSVLLEIDCDGHRAGLAVQDPELVQVADLLRAAGQTVAGVLTHAGSAYDCPDVASILALAEQEQEAALQAAALLRSRGHACPIVSVGSTPTALLGTPRSGISEVRAGVYLFMDLVMEGLGVCSLDDLALSVLTSVIGGFPEQGRQPARLLTDAGWAALSSDRGLERRFASQGFGLVCTMEGGLLPGIRVAELNQEHGMLSVTAHPDGEVRETLMQLRADSRLRILPNHACATAMMHQSFYLVRDNRAVALLPRFGGW